MGIKIIDKLALCFVLSFLSCGKNMEKDMNFKGIVIEVNSPIEVPIEDLINEYKIITLEDLEESIIDDVSEMRIMNDKLYIKDRRGLTIYIFTLEGRYISKINNSGVGPEEYISIYGFEVDHKNLQIILSDTFSKRVFIYDEYGEIKKVIPLDFQPNRAFLLGNNIVNLYSGNKNLHTSDEMENYSIHYLDSLGKFVSSSIPVELKKRIDIFPSHQLSNTSMESSFLFNPMFSDTIYLIENGYTFPHYLINNKTKYKSISNEIKQNTEFIGGITEDKIFRDLEERNYLLTWGEVLNLNDWLFHSFSNWHKDKLYVYYSKINNSAISVERSKLKGNEILKDVFLKYPLTTYENKFYTTLDLVHLDQVKGELPKGELKQLMENIDILESNPVLISFSINYISDL